MSSTYKQFLLYCLKFLGVFAIAYFGTLAWIGLASPGNYYSPFIDHYLDYVAWMRFSLLHGSKFLLSIFGYATTTPDAYTLQMVGGRGIHIGYDCIGYGVMSFWLALMVANKGSFKTKFIWILGGSLLLWFINIIRISLFLLSLNKHQTMPFGIDNHLFFNITAYAGIFVMIYFYDRRRVKDTGY